MSDMISSLNAITWRVRRHSAWLQKHRQIQEVTEKVGTDHYEGEFLNNLGAPHGKDLLEGNK